MGSFFSVDLLEKENIDCSKFVRYEKREKNYIYSLEGLEVIKNKEKYIHKKIGDDMNKFEKRITKIPKGYRKKNLNDKNSKDWIKKLECDTSKQLLKKNNDEYKNIKKQLQNSKKYYFIHDNGGRPYLVYIYKSDVYIYKFDEEKYYLDSDCLSRKDKNNKWIYTKLVKKYIKPVNIFIGKSHENYEISKLSGAYGDEYDGNSILLHINKKGNKNTYVLIGKGINQFTINDSIQKFYSPVGANNVPYPFAYGNKNLYFLVSNKYLPYKHIDMDDKLKNMEPIDVYWGDIGFNNPTFDKYKKIRMKTISKRIY